MASGDDCRQAKTRRLEMENQRLVSLLSNMKEAQFRENAERILQLEEDNTRLKLKVEDLEQDQRGKEGKMSEIMDSVTTRAAIADKKNVDLQRTHQEQKNQIEALKADRCRMEELEQQIVSMSGENQKLGRSVELFQRRVESAQCESRDLETENSKLQKTVEGLRHSLRRLNELEKENTDLESDNHRLDRESKGLHKEIARLKQAIETKDGSLDEYSSKLSTSERQQKRLSKDLELVHNQGSRLRELERENKDLQHATVVERKTLAAIREELVQEKIRCQQLQCQMDTNVRTLEQSRTESHSLRLNNEELTRTCERHSAEKNTQSAQSAPTLELGREVLAVKDRLVELERQNAVLLAEKDNLKTHIAAQKDQVLDNQSQLTAISQQLATLQVENSTLSSQLNSVSSQNSTLQTSLTQVEGERDGLVQQLQTSQNRLDQLSRDQSELQKLHEQLTSEYETLLTEKEQLKCSQRELKAELRIVNEKLTTAVQVEEDWQRSRQELQDELDKSKGENRSLVNLRAEHSRLKDDFRSLFVANDKLKNEYKNLQTDYKSMRGEHNALKLKHTQLQGETAECRHQATNMDVEIGKLNNKCQVLTQWNTTLEEDKRNLVNQVTVLLAQYHELLSQTLEEKDHFHEETKNFSDKLNHLKRQKEILEDKIMEQYRRMENTTPLKKNPKASIGALFVRKMRRASSELIKSVPRSRSRSRGHLGSDRDSPDQQDAQDTFSLESGSHSGSNSGCGSLDSGGEGDMTPTGNRSERQRIRQSMPIINYDHQETILRTSFSSDALLLERNANSTTESNGNVVQDPLNSSLNSNSSSIHSNSTLTSTANCNLLNATLSGLPNVIPNVIPNVKLYGQSTSLSLTSSPVPFQRFIQPSRSLALLERAGSRQPLCITDVDDPVVLDIPDDADIVPTRDAGPRITPPLSDSASDKNNDNCAGSTQNIVTSTTRINVNVNVTTPGSSSSSSSSSSSALERLGSIRIAPPRPSPRITPPALDLDEIPPIPARGSVHERAALPPALPPRLNSSIVSSSEEKAADNGNAPSSPSCTTPPANSIWYEYGCV